MSLLLRLPIEGVLENISDFIRTNHLSHTCKLLWTALRLRHISKVNKYSTSPCDFNEYAAKLHSLFPLVHQTAVTLNLLNYHNPKPWGPLEHPFVRLRSLKINCSGWGSWRSADDLSMLHLISPAMWCLRELRLYWSWCRRFQNDDLANTDLFIQQFSEALQTGNSLELFELDNSGAFEGMNAQNLQHLAEGIRPHVNLQSFTLHFKDHSLYPTPSVSSLLAALPTSLTALDLSIGTFDVTAINTLTSVFFGDPASRLTKVVLSLHECLSLAALLRAVMDSKLRELGVSVSADGSLGSEPVQWSEVVLPTTLNHFSIGGNFVTTELRGSLAGSLLAGWTTHLFRGPGAPRGTLLANR
eukprot:TRINITY_DN54513_c1_g1_i1.p1 TRINITY_DN54513_c1_g1~~TRINITY_DN54513_c1_g1_i1.p1  ORF type:complete len:357 (+),score=-17.53 TRINITY_DN54513_c1_g1_i1:27-1097(+)